MSAEAGESTATAQGDRKGPHGEQHPYRESFRQIWKECQEESFWYRALPASLGSMAVTGGLIYQGIWNASKRFGPFPKLAVAGVLGYAVGKASYVGNCREKFQKLGLFHGSGDGPGFGPGFGPGRGFGPGWAEHRRCPHVCEECKKHNTTSSSAETAQS